MNYVRAGQLQPGEQVNLVDGPAFVLRGPRCTEVDRTGLVMFDFVDTKGQTFSRSFDRRETVELAP